MKSILFVIVLSLCLIVPTYAQSNPNSKSSLIDLNLSPQQRQAMQAAILEYKRSERMKKAELRAKLFKILNSRQQATVLHWRRIHR